MTTEAPATPALEGEIMPAAGTAIAEYNATAQALAELTERYAGKSYEVATTAGMKEAREARAELRTLRTTLEATRQEIKAPVLERGRLIDAEAKRITEALVGLENPIDQQIKAEETRKAEERAALEKIEAARQAELTAKIERRRAFPLLYVAAPVGVIGAAIASKEGVPPSEEEFGDRYDEALAVHNGMMAQLQALLAAAETREAEAAKLAEQQAEIARQQAELKAQQDAAQAERDEADRIANAKRAEEDRVARLERERLAEQQAERQRELDEAAKAERERQQAADAERERVAQMARDAVAQEQAERLEAERTERLRLEREAAAAKLDAEHKAIQSATLHQAATDALALLVSLGQGEQLVTRKLVSALAREPKPAKRAKKATALHRAALLP